MARKFRYDIIQRWEGNPLITIDDIPFQCNTIRITVKLSGPAKVDIFPCDASSLSKAV
ncbi:MAG: hypothetical protein ACYS6K_22980 [Planctomycetota bacterium]